jgi:hypothetical protein
MVGKDATAASMRCGQAGSRDQSASMAILRIDFAVFLTLMFICAASAAGCTDKHEPAGAVSRTRQLLSYREEQGGVVARSTSLTVSTSQRAVVRFEGCMAQLHVGGRAWMKLKRALIRARLHSLAGSYGTTRAEAEQSTWTIVSGRDTIRVRAFTFPPKLRAKLEPLLAVVDEVISTGKRRLPRTCARKIVSQGVAGNGTYAAGDA